MQTTAKALTLPVSWCSKSKTDRQTPQEQQEPGNHTAPADIGSFPASSPSTKGSVTREGDVGTKAEQTGAGARDRDTECAGELPGGVH